MDALLTAIDLVAAVLALCESRTLQVAGNALPVGRALKLQQENHSKKAQNGSAESLVPGRRGT